MIHVLEEPLLPKKDSFIHLTARKVLAGMNATRFIRLFDENGLGAYLDNDQNEVITLLAPSNEGLEEEDNFDIFKSKTKEWLKYHIVHGFYEPSDLVDGQLLETESTFDLGKNNYQRLDVHIGTQDGDIINKSIQFGESGVLGEPGKKEFQPTLNMPFLTHTHISFYS